MTWLITYLDNSGALRSAISYLCDSRYQVRLHFLADYPAAQEILLCEQVNH